MKFNVPGRFPGTNEIIEAAKLCKRNYKEYAVMKDTYTNMVAWLAKKLPKYECVNLIITWYEPNEKRDIDNVSGGVKFICDGLVRAGTIPNDTRKYVKSITHKFETDRQNPRIEIEVEAV